MKKSKRLAALIAAVLMTVTMFSSAVPAYAVTQWGSLNCAGQGASCKLESANKNNAYAQTWSIKTFDELSAYVLGCEVDSKGDVVRYKGITQNGTKTDSGKATITTLKSTNKFENITSIHGVKKGSSEAMSSKPLAIHWK